jgi:hypothetical protein
MLDCGVIVSAVTGGMLAAYVLRYLTVDVECCLLHYFIVFIYLIMSECQFSVILLFWNGGVLFV